MSAEQTGTPVQRCLHCGNAFLAVTWLAYRARGFCREKCEEDAAKGTTQRKTP